MPKNSPCVRTCSCARPRVNLSQAWFVDDGIALVVRFTRMLDHSFVRFQEVRLTFSPIARAVPSTLKVTCYPDVIRTPLFFSAADYRPCFDRAYRSSLRDRSTGVGRKHPSVFGGTVYLHSVLFYAEQSCDARTSTASVSEPDVSVVAACDAALRVLRLVACVFQLRFCCVRKVERAHFRRGAVCVAAYAFSFMRQGGAACLS
jgi:hypothetical protein